MSIASFSFQFFIPNLLLFSLPHPLYLCLLFAYYNYNFTSAYLMSNLWFVDFLVIHCLYTCNCYHLQIQRRGGSFPVRGFLAGPSCIGVIRTLFTIIKMNSTSLNPLLDFNSKCLIFFKNPVLCDLALINSGCFYSCQHFRFLTITVHQTFGACSANQTIHTLLWRLWFYFFRENKADL